MFRLSSSCISSPLSSIWDPDEKLRVLQQLDPVLFVYPLVELPLCPSFPLKFSLVAIMTPVAASSFAGHHPEDAPLRGCTRLIPSPPPPGVYLDSFLLPDLKQLLYSGCHCKQDEDSTEFLLKGTEMDPRISFFVFLSTAKTSLRPILRKF